MDWQIFLNIINNLVKNTFDIKHIETSVTGWTGKYVLANCHLQVALLRFNLTIFL